MGGDFIAAEGTVTDVHRGGLMRVVLGNGHEVLARPAGKMMLNRIRCLPGDRVTVELSPYDLTKGRITYRFK
jgi:translation initiation factor IF-1